MEVQQRLQAAVSDAQVQGARTTQTAQSVMQQGQHQFREGVQGAVEQASSAVQHTRSSIEQQFVSPSTPFRDLRPQAATASVRPVRPGNFPTSGSGHSPNTLRHVPPEMPPATPAASVGLAFGPSSQQPGGPLHAYDVGSNLDPPPSAPVTASPPQAAAQPPLPASSAAAADAFPSTSAGVSRAWSEAKTSEYQIAKPPSEAALGEGAPSPAASPVEALAAAQSGRDASPLPSAAARQALPQDAPVTAASTGAVDAAAATSPAPAAVRKKLRQRRVPSSQLGRSGHQSARKSMHGDLQRDQSIVSTSIVSTTCLCISCRARSFGFVAKLLPVLLVFLHVCTIAFNFSKSYQLYILIAKYRKHWTLTGARLCMHVHRQVEQ